MPSAPNIEGLPLWLQITMSVAFALATIWMAVKGYVPKPKLPPGADNAQIIGAQFADMGAIRRLGEICIELGTQMEGLEAAIREQTHWTREGNELSSRSFEALRAFQMEREIERRVEAGRKAD